MKTLRRWSDPQMDSQGSGARRVIDKRRRDLTNGLERPGLTKGQTEPPDRPQVAYNGVLVGVE